MKKPLIVIFTLLWIVSCKKESSTPDPFVPETAYAVSPGDYLSAAKYSKLVIEIVYVEGQQPDPATVASLVDFLQLHLNKPAGIEVTQRSIPSPGKSILSLDDVKAIETANRDQTLSKGVLKMFMLFSDGDYSQNTSSSKVLGVTYSASSIVIFNKTIHGISGGLGQPSSTSVEISVAEHESGHVLGLVNNGAAMVVPHQDEPHGRHCNTKSCLMYYNAETSDMIANLTNNNIPSLDANCLNDLKAAGGK